MYRYPARRHRERAAHISRARFTACRWVMEVRRMAFSRVLPYLLTRYTW